ncbi:MAG TPA: caspase family protein [Hyphomicrobiaceae bacterium]|nr:caspase family protein [Hyphomicrobiaceae bacterium]
MLGRVIVGFIACIVASALPAMASAPKKVALIIGNSGYRNAPPLKNPKSDAELLARTLSDVGFDVTHKTDLTYNDLRIAIRDFGPKAAQSEIAIIHFAGHGMELGGENYVLPIDARLRSDVDLEYEAVTLTSLMRATIGARRLRLVILDACRDNPIGDRMSVTTGATRSFKRGLTRVEPAGDQLVAFAARAGSVALDGDGAISPYTSALAKHLLTPGLDVRLVFGRVRDDVLASTKGQQEPFIYGSLRGDVIPLVASASAETEEAQRERLRAAAEATAKAKAAELEAKRLIEEAERKRREAEDAAKRVTLELEEAEKRRREAVAEAERRRRELAEEAERLKRESEEEAERRRVAAAEEADRRRREAQEEEERRKAEQLARTFRFRVCNDSRHKAHVAISFYSSEQDGFFVEGWWTVNSGECAYLKRARKGWFYFYADGSNRGWWGGDHSTCVSNRVFLRLHTPNYTCSNNERLVKFKALNIQDDEYTWRLGD